jgi:4a-hydroxytetrahydrobiopterin dehydratase
MELSQRDLKPPRDGNTLPLTGEELASLFELLGNHWIVLQDQRLAKEYKFSDFQGALEFTNRVGALAESVDHHPEICLSWGKVRITIWTHSIGGLSEADFVFAAKVDQLSNDS